jgi:16S rRNA (guanine527-N7)-methyltransferase
MEPTNDDSLTEALRRHELEMPATQVEALDRYVQAMWEINQSLNLTRHTTYEKFVTRDVVDSLQLAALLDEGASVLDVGSGGGVPGAVMAVVRPDLRIELCESVAKKANALREILDRSELSLPVHHARGEALLAERRFDAVVARAVAPLVRMLKWFAPHWSHMGCLLATKGTGWVAERGEARHRGFLKTLELRRAAVYKTPGTGAENVILKIWPGGEHDETDQSP